MLKKLLFCLFFLYSCAQEESENDIVSGEISQALTTSYGTKVNIGSGPFAGSVGTEVAQYHPFKPGYSGGYVPCFEPTGQAGGCVGPNYYKYAFDGSQSPTGNTVSYQWNNPSAAPNGSVGSLQVQLCYRLMNIGFDTLAADYGCVDVSSTHNGFTHAFDVTPKWGNQLNFVTVKGIYPEFRFIYKYLPTLAAPNGTPCNNCLIPSNSVTINHRQETYP